MTAKERDRILAKRYPSEGSSDSLCRALMLQSWQVRWRAQKLGVKVNQELKTLKQRKWCRGGYTA